MVKTPAGASIHKSAHIIREQIVNSRFREVRTSRRRRSFSREVFGFLMLDLWLNRYACPGAAKAAR
jgi:hypothetical protein